MMMKKRRRQAEQRLQHAMHARRLIEVLAPHDVGHALKGIVHHDRQMIARGRVLAREHDIAPFLRLGHEGFVVLLRVGADPKQDHETLMAEPQAWGDVVLARKDTPTSYHLSVVVDDALQGVTHVVRGQDLYQATSVHRVLQTLLGLPAPLYHHHRLILDAAGQKLAKSTQATALRELRQRGVTPADIRRMVGLA